MNLKESEKNLGHLSSKKNWQVLQAAAIQTHQLSCRTEVGTPRFGPSKDCSLFVVFLVVLVVIINELTNW